MGKFEINTKSIATIGKVVEATTEQGAIKKYNQQTRQDKTREDLRIIRRK